MRSCLSFVLILLLIAVLLLFSSLYKSCGFYWYFRLHGWCSFFDYEELWAETDTFSKQRVNTVKHLTAKACMFSFNDGDQRIKCCLNSQKLLFQWTLHIMLNVCRMCRVRFAELQIILKACHLVQPWSVWLIVIIFFFFKVAYFSFFGLWLLHLPLVYYSLA